MSVDCNVILGDSYEVLLDDELIAEDSIDTVVTSPPYDGARKYKSEEAQNVDHSLIAEGLFRVLKPGGIVAYNIQGPVANWRGLGPERSTIPLRCVGKFLKAGFMYHECGVFYRLGAPGAYTGRFRCDHEFIHFFKKPGDKHYWDKYAISREPVAQPMKGVAKVRKKDGTFNERSVSGYAVENGVKIHGTVFEYGNVGRDAKGVKHPAVMSIRLARDLVELLCPVGGVVLDPFSGAATTGVACKELGRNYIGIEMSEDYYEESVRRLESVAA